MASLNSSDKYVQGESFPLLLQRIYKQVDASNEQENQQPSSSYKLKIGGMYPFLLASGLAAAIAVIVLITVFTGSPAEQQSLNGQRSVLKASAAPSEDEKLVIATPLGKIRGYPLTSREGREYYAFYKVPYAQAPIGNLRFRSPEPVEKWEGIRDFAEVAPQCIQRTKYSSIIEAVGEEDCLYMIPKENEEVFHLMPTMFYIHGGGFTDGNGSRYGGKYFLDEDVVLITFQYRLGPFGFLSTNDEDIAGNMAFKDQVMALKWTRDNIKFFGGDPNRVLIFGNSAGAFSVSHLMISPMASGLFRTAITQSGASICQTYMTEDQTKATFDSLAKEVGCTSRNRRRLLRCLRQVNAEDLAITKSPSIAYALSIDNYTESDVFMPDSPYNMLVSGRVNRIPWLVGVNSAEFVHSAAGSLRDPEFIKELNVNWTTASQDLFWIKGEFKEDVALKAKTFYFGNNSIGNETLRNFSDLVSDRNVVYCSKVHAQLQSEYSSVYLYYMSKRPRKSYSDKALEGFPPGDYGAAHADEIQYLFDYNGYPEYPIEDKEYFPFSRYLIQIWSEFAATGKPSLHKSNINGTEWKKISPKEQQIFWMELNDERKPTNILQSRMNFWDQFPVKDLYKV